MAKLECEDRMLVAELVQRERAARDAGLWDIMAECWHPNSLVDVSWFRGRGADFVAASARNSGGKTLSFHQMGPSVITMRGSRALADTGCAVQAMLLLEGAGVAVISHTRLLSRAVKEGDDWLLAGLRVIYIRDLLVPRNPNRVPAIDETALNGYRDSYRYLSYVLAQSGHAPRVDLPGFDEMANVTSVRLGEQHWLHETDA